MTENPSTSGHAELLAAAANLIRRHGYNPAAPHDPGPGYSVTSALCTAAECGTSGRHIGLCEELHGQVAGYLYLTGQAVTGRLYLPDTVDLWEAYSPGEGWRSKPEAEGVLAAASKALTAAVRQQHEQLETAS